MKQSPFCKVFIFLEICVSYRVVHAGQGCCSATKYISQEYLVSVVLANVKSASSILPKCIQAYQVWLPLMLGRTLHPQPVSYTVLFLEGPVLVCQYQTGPVRKDFKWLGPSVHIGYPFCQCALWDSKFTFYYTPPCSKAP